MDKAKENNYLPGTVLFVLMFLSAYHGQVNAIPSSTAGIPKSFHGVWDSNQESCSYKNSDSRVRIRSKEITEDEALCRLKRVMKSTEVAFSGIFACTGEGETEVREISIQLIHNKLVGYYQGDSLIRCK